MCADVTFGRVFSLAWLKAGKNLFTHCIVFANLMVSYVKKLLKFRTVIVFVKKPHLLPSPMYCMTGHTLLLELP